MTDTTAATGVGTRTPGGVGADAPRPDGGPKVRGEFAFSGDLWADGMVWGATLRSPHASARIRSIDTSPALEVPGVIAVVTAEDLPGSRYYGLEHRDQPVFAWEVVRYAGEPVAAVAADHPETARRALQAIAVDYEVLPPLVDAEAALTADPLHPDGNVFRHMWVRKGDADVRGPIVVEGTYEVGMQDQAFMGPEAGLAIPGDDGGVDLVVSTQWLHNDRDQIAECLGLPPERVRMTLGGVGGAFGGREDVSFQVHAALLAQVTQRPVKVVYSREESFLGHVHRHPATIWMRHSAEPDGTIVSFEARILLDGGAYRSSSYHVVANASCFAAGPYTTPNAVVEGIGVRTNNPPCGAMRGFGAVQVCFAHEAQMDKLADACGVDRVELRLRNAMGTGDTLLTGQVVEGALPTAEVIRATAALPLPPLHPPAGDADPMVRPGGAGRTAEAGDVVRATGFAVGFKNLMYAEGYDDDSHAACRLEAGIATVTCAAAEVGQGFVTLAQQITREVLGVTDVLLAPADTATIATAGSTSASRQTWMSGGAVEKAARAVREQVVAHVAGLTGAAEADLRLRDGRVVAAAGPVEVDVAVAGLAPAFEASVRFQHRQTFPLDADGQGDAHVSFACAAHRATVDVDPELGLVRVVEVATAQDVGRVLNPTAALGQIEGGIAQGVGLATMEEVVLVDGKPRNPSFTDYLIPTALDMPAVSVAWVEEPEPDAPFGAKGVGEPPVISSTPAVVAAVRSATGRPLTRVPMLPADIAGLDP
ncbi:xanthine dehydrogenase subunit D [Iamia sp. SCSIO 61187]|uniref:xanthine dehydrogenase subunit D n=1 Tax=Iamia sp. SCSIO 61187 TaxID=2722752 RepID=UPI001C6352D7|nr:xanthine dehydrogenase subunit D [Iamia sp. SCSIO 61187]QYG93133.1 xanthine dehydrogenase subunit D [Iamia sp. SCSIO 61187]